MVRFWRPSGGRLEPPSAARSVRSLNACCRWRALATATRWLLACGPAGDRNRSYETPRAWHWGQKCADRPPMTMRSSGVPQRTQGRPLRP